MTSESIIGAPKISREHSIGESLSRVVIPGLCCVAFTVVVFGIGVLPSAGVTLLLSTYCAVNFANVSVYCKLMRAPAGMFVGCFEVFVLRMYIITKRSSRFPVCC